MLPCFRSAERGDGAKNRGSGNYLPGFVGYFDECIDVKMKIKGMKQGLSILHEISFWVSLSEIDSPSVGERWKHMAQLITF